MTPEELKAALDEIGLALDTTHGCVVTGLPDAMPDEAHWRVNNLKALQVLGDIDGAFGGVRGGVELLAIPHYSDCAVNNAPAFPAGPCSCGAVLIAERKWWPLLRLLARNRAARLRTQYRSWLFHAFSRR